jgi:AhpD family alkylhydroperoxidase
MDDQTKELIAIGASVTANCEPCLKYHLNQAKEYGASEELIVEAIEVGKMVKKGAMGKYNEFISSILKVTDHSLNVSNEDSGCG